MGVNGLAELAPHIAAGTIRVLAISSAERLPGLDAPTFREQGVDVEIENWRSVVAPPGISVAERQRLERTIEAMVRSEPGKPTLEQLPLERSLPRRDRVRALQRRPRKRGSKASSPGWAPERLRPARSTADVGPLSALRPRRAGRHGVTFCLRRHRARMAARVAAVRGSRLGRQRARVGTRRGGGRCVDLLLLDSAGFVLASTAMFWLTARAFDSTHPLRGLRASPCASFSGRLLCSRACCSCPLPPGLLGPGRSEHQSTARRCSRRSACSPTVLPARSPGRISPGPLPASRWGRRSACCPASARR